MKRDIITDTGLLLFAIFALLVILRLSGIIACSWWIVTMPLWLPIVFIILLGIALIVYNRIADTPR